MFLALKPTFWSRGPTPAHYTSLARRVFSVPFLFSAVVGLAIFGTLHNAPQPRAMLAFLWRRIWPAKGLLKFSNRNHKVLPSDLEIDEEMHELSRYYPAKIGDVIEDRYQIVGKLGFGVGSTVWLANEFKTRRTAALKIFTNDEQNIKETGIYRYLQTIRSEHPGRYLIRNAWDFLTIKGPNGEHQCLALEPMLEDTERLLTRNPNRRFTEDLLKVYLIRLLLALDYLHMEARLVHTDISSSNILMEIEDHSIIREFIKSEQERPSPRKEVEGHFIYASRRLSSAKVGPPVLSDFGSTVAGDVEHDEDVQPNVYRAPEVCLKAPWNYSIDIWNVGCLIWDLFEGKHMFHGQDPEKETYMTRAHLADMVALMGPPPLDLLKRGKRTAEFFDENGQWRADIPIPERTSLEESEEYLEGSNKEAFLRFMRKMIQWRPEDRWTARHLLGDEWLRLPSLCQSEKEDRT